MDKEMYTRYVCATLNILLKDRTTGNNILLLSNSYTDVNFNSQITKDLLRTIRICPHYMKSKSIKNERKKKKSEVFTPSCLCNDMINLYDEMWFGRKDVFNIVYANNKDKTWKDYVDLVCMEITCGEAPFLVSRYDAATGEIIPLKKRIGILDRKIRIVNENVTGHNDWIKWITRAFENVYGYEYQGDNLFVARINLLLTFIEYYFDRFKKEPPLAVVMKISKIISYNIIQMDGLTYKIPSTEYYAKIKDWKNNSILYFKDIGN